MKTYEDVLTRYDVEVPPHLVAQADVPVLTAPQRQGDVWWRPTKPGAEIGEPIPAQGIAVVRGENGGNTHLLVGEGTWVGHAPNGPADLHLGVLTVPKDQVAFVIHPEHGANAIGEGCYRFGRKRDAAREIARVRD